LFYAWYGLLGSFINTLKSYLDYGGNYTLGGSNTMYKISTKMYPKRIKSYDFINREVLQRKPREERQGMAEHLYISKELLDQIAAMKSMTSCNV
jgi:hypothetical protein